MDINKIQKWLEFTNKNQNNDFWQRIFDHQKPEQFFDTDDYKPNYDIYRNDTHVCVVFELPGVAKEDVKFSLKSHVDLIVTGQIRALYPIEMEVEKLRYYGDFERIVRLPEPTEAQLISLHFQHGLVYVTYPIQDGENVKQI